MSESKSNCLLAAVLACCCLSSPTLAQPRGEVVILGAIHAPWQFRSAAFTPAHLRAALALAKPDLIGVESNPTWFARGQFHDVTYEAQRIAIPYAKAHNLPAFGIDWMNIESWDQRIASRRAQRQQMISDTLSRGALHPAILGRMGADHYEKARSYFLTSRFRFQHVNDIGDDSYGARWIKNADPDSPRFGGKRNRKIVEHCLKALGEHPGERLVVVIGAGHKKVLEILLAQHQGIRVLRYGMDIPAPTDAQVEAAWTTEDLLCALGHNLDGERTYFHPELINLEWMEQLVKRLDEGDHQRQADYFRARILTTRATLLRASQPEVATQLAEQATATFAKLASGEGAEIYPFPMDHWRMTYDLRQAACLEQAKLFLVDGQRDAAERLLTALRREVPAPSAALPEPAAQVAPSAATEMRDVVTNPGFEEPLADSPSGGWFCEAIRLGRARAAVDVETKCEGQGSLAVSIVKSGRVPISVTQRLRVPEDRGQRDIEITVQARGEGVTNLHLIAYRWDDTQKAMKRLASEHVPLRRGTWTPAKIAFAPPKSAPHVFVFLYFNGEPGSKIWLDQAATSLRVPAVEAPTVPADWIPRTLAREYPRTLLAHPH